MSLSDKLFGGGGAGRCDSEEAAAKSATPTPPEEDFSETITCGGPLSTFRISTAGTMMQNR